MCNYTDRHVTILSLCCTCTDVRDNIEGTPLHHACDHGHLEVVKYLVETAHCDVGKCSTCSHLADAEEV